MIVRRVAEAMKQRDWFVVLLELTIVVVGIIVGLQVDDWNQRRLDREEEHRVLLRIHDELLTSVQPDDPSRAAAARYADILTNLPEIIEPSSGRNALTDAECEALANATVYEISFETMPSLDALIASGRLSIIANGDLQARLIRMNQQIMDYWSEIDRASQFPFNAYLDYGGKMTSSFARGNEGERPVISYQCDLAAIRADADFILAFHSAAYFGYGKYFFGAVQPVLEQAAVLHELLDREVGLDH